MTDSKNKELSVEEVMMEERKFLHDISNHLVVAQGMGSFLKKALSTNEAVGEKEKERCEKVNKAVIAIGELLKKRREVLHERTKKDED